MYLRDREALRTDSSGMEIRPEGLELFDAVANDIDLERMPSGQLFIRHHWHDEAEIFVLTRGRVRVEAADLSATLESGDGCFINSGVIHSFDSCGGEPYVFRSIVFDTSIVGGAPDCVFDRNYVRPLLESGAALYRFAPGEGDAAFFAAFDEAFAALRDEPDLCEFTVRGALSRIVAAALRRTEGALGAAAEKSREEPVKRMLRFIGSHLCEPIAVEDIASSAGVGKRDCYRLFRRFLRTSPMDYVLGRRIQLASRRIASTDEPIALIAMDCGFPTPNYFTRRFRAQTGMTPREWRRAARGARQGEKTAAK